MKTVKFKFDIGDKVQTIYCQEVIVRELIYNEDGNQYTLKSENGDWFKEYFRENELKKNRI